MARRLARLYVMATRIASGEIMRRGQHPLNSASRCTSLLLVGALSVCLLGCLPTPPPELEAYKRSVLKIRFDSNTTVFGVPRGPDESPHAVADVVEIMGPVIGQSGDSLLMNPAYALILIPEHPVAGRVIRRVGRGTLPDEVIVVLGPGVRVEQPYQGPHCFSMVPPIIAGLITEFLLLQHGRH